MATLRHARHLPRQLPAIAALGGAAIGRRKRVAKSAPPNAEVVREIAPIPDVLVRDYVEHVGGDPAAYRGTVPPHLFPRWGMPLAARALAGLDYPWLRVINGGCRLEMAAPLPAGEPLIARARVIDIDDDGRRAAIAVRVVTGTGSVPDAVTATIRAIIPLAGASRASRPPREGVPHDAHELARWHIPADAGLAFAMLTGDVNPIHWSERAGAAAGFGGAILHGFSTFARAFEGVVRARYSGDASRIRVWDARLVRPLRLPADAGLFARGDRAWVADAPGGAPYLAMSMHEATP